MSNDAKESKPANAPRESNSLKRRDLLLTGTSLVAASAIAVTGLTVQAQAQQQQPAAAPASGKKQNILVIFGDDIGQSNISAYTFGSHFSAG
jgi:alkaline phosphatase